MNLFVTDKNPTKASKHLDNVRLNKMLIETCQLLATALIMNGAREEDLPKTKSGKYYRKTHFNHPVAKWVRETKGNYRWTVLYLRALLTEYTDRTGKEYKSVSSNMDIFERGSRYIPDGEQTPFVNASMFKDNTDIFQAYKDTLVKKWKEGKIIPKIGNVVIDINTFFVN